MVDPTQLGIKKPGVEGGIVGNQMMPGKESLQIVHYFFDTRCR
jgi:hypothetical protein